jgi:ribosomal protein RSM22 (predicted rRNA methylase)
LDLNASEESTLNLSAYQLLSLSSDSAREQHVRSLWNSGAEAIVLIEEGTDRGFAAIASARALLLELGEEAKVEDVATPVTSTEDDDGQVRERLVLGGVEFIEERASDRVFPQEPRSAEGSTGRGCYVVAPCPHDRPCPLLHPFLLDLDHDTVTDVAKRSGPSHHHRASGVGLNSCLHPVRYLPPSWSRDLGSEERRRKREKGGREERSARMAYVVVKRGERPTMESLRQEADGEAVQRVEAAVPYARRGPIEALRKGDSLPRRLPEDVVDIEGEDGEVDLQGDLSPSGELFKLLPADLQQALSASPGGGEQVGEERQLSQDKDLLERAAAAALQGYKTNTDSADVWAASAEAADSAKAEQAEVEEAEATTEAEHNDDWLSTLLAANEGGGEGFGRDAAAAGAAASVEPEPSASDVASAVSLLVPSLPRIVMPPIKKGGHVTFDACHSNGSIQRYTISKAAGKQTYHEVRKSSWADLWSQDPVELAGRSRRVMDGEAAEGFEEEEENEDDGDDDLSLLETRDEATGRRKWIKRRGWGQWSRVAPADPSAGMAMDGTGTPFKSPSSSSPRSTRASDRPSAYIGADQVCPLTSSGEVKGSKKKSSALSAATTSAAAGQRGARSRKAAKAYAGPRDKESKRKRSMNSYHEEVAEGFDSLSL